LVRALICAPALFLAATPFAHAADAMPVAPPGSAVGAFPPNPAPTPDPTLAPPPPPPPPRAPAPPAQAPLPGAAPAPAAAPIPVPAPAPAASAAPGPGTIQAEGNERFTLNFRNMPIEQVFELLSRNDKVNIILSKGVSGTVSVNLYNVTVKEAIQSVANAGGYWVEVRNGDYVILPKDTAELPESSTQVKTLKVQYSDTTQIAALLTQYKSRYGKITPLIGRKLIVVEDLPTNLERIEKLLEQIDSQPRQIMIEAKILEITLDESERFGVDWKRLFGSPLPGSGGSFGTSGLATGSASTPSQGFFFSFLNSRVELYFDALATAGRVRTLSTPKLLALENQESKVIIGDSTGYKVTTTINLVTTESVLFLESGVILRVIPSVDQRGRIMLKIQPEVSSASLLAGIPSKKSIQVTTELICDDGQSIFIGGLIKARGSTERDGVPILKDIPVLGRLFSSTNDAVSTSETVVIITPYIVAQPADIARESAAKARDADDAVMRIRELQQRLERGRPVD
jgi:type II secretory pathway component GspD/PulD (secretin)